MASKYPVLETDAIREAVFEIRFENMSGALPEILFGRLASYEALQNFKQQRLPVLEIPEIIRNAQPELRHTPLYSLVSQDGTRSVQVGNNVILTSAIGEYPGWDGGFGKSVNDLCDWLFELIPGVMVSRLGLRYINALRSDIHGVHSISELDIKIAVPGLEIDGPYALNFRSKPGTEFEATNRLSTVEFAGGSIPENTTVVFDIDVHTPDGYLTNDLTVVKKWADLARHEKNERFFSVIGKEVEERLCAK